MKPTYVTYQLEDPSLPVLLNQVCTVTDHMPVRAQFLKIAFVHDVGMCVYVHLLGY